MKNLLLGALISMVLAFGITHNAQAEDSSKTRTIIEAANAAWNQALNSGNVAELAKLYTENATLSPGNGQNLTGRVEIEKLFKGFVDNGVHNHKIEIIESGENGELIYQVSKWSANGAEVNGKTPSFGGITMSVLKKDSAGKWHIQSHVWNVAS